MIKNVFPINQAKKSCTRRGAPPRYNNLLLAVTALACSLFSAALTAETETAPAGLTGSETADLCPASSSGQRNFADLPVFSAENIGNTNISADSTRSGNNGSILLDGNVIIERHLLRINADHAYYDKQKDLLQISGDVRLNTETLSLDADDGTVTMITADEVAGRQGSFTNAKFFIPVSNMKGTAETLVSREGKDSNLYSTLTDASITTCDLLDPDWLISADEIRLDHADEYGSADDVVVRFKDIPFLYTPYIEFPTSNKRRSGLLFPELGNSSSRGVEIAIPWYWNIAPNQDAVFIPRNMARRGVELGGKYRYLTQSTDGELTGAWLSEDRITEEQRYQVRYQQHSRIQSNLLLNIDLQDISDPNYFNDFSNNLGSTSQTHLDRNATLNYNLQDWQMGAQLRNLKTIDTTVPVSRRPYTLLPRLTLNGEQELAGNPAYFTLDSEFTDFTHEDDSKITGSRLMARPGLRLQLDGTAWFFEPAVKFSHTQYSLDTDNVATTISENYIERNLTMSSIDTGLFFERNLDNGFLQTLEPRLYYLYVPYEDQSNIPIFDTSIPEFSVAQLFRDNRFVGHDRIGDANQLTLALSSRLLDPASGDEFLRASIGRIYYFEDREVSLNNTIETAKQSDVVAELDLNWGHWQNNIDLQWSTENNEFTKSNLLLHYESDARHIFNIGYRRHLKNGVKDIEQSDLSFVYPLNRRYSTFARWNYSLLDNQHIDIIGGIAYDSCCWSVQLLAQRRRQNTSANTVIASDDYDNALLVQFVFKGLGSLSGNKVQTTLEQSIFGYTDITQ